MLRLLSALAILGSAGCKGFDPGTPTGLPTPPTEEDTAPPTGTTPTPPPVAPEEALRLPATQPVETASFATADSCEACHANAPTSDAMRDDVGGEVGPYDLWSASMMANAARDPIWRAVVSAEIAATPGAADLIGQRCMNCHAPMAYSDSVLTSTASPTIDTLTAGTQPSDLALDGVSCTLCHQIDPAGLGTEDSWKGNYAVVGDRTIYGPHSAPHGEGMVAAGWNPVQSSHINNASLCATCHTLITDALAPDGTATGGSIVEQAPYLEMLNSMHGGSSCQSCHLPQRTDIDGVFETPIARNPDGTDDDTLPDRAVGRHVFVGGNTLVPQLFRDNHDLLKPNAPAEAFNDTILSARSQLLYRTAFLGIEQATVVGSTLSFDARITLSTGHKFPTGIPLRRAWLRVEVRDSSGQTVFLSGDFDSQGRILVDGVPAPFEAAGGPVAPHRDTVVSADQVQVYEAIMADEAGDTTFLLLRGAGWVKDNRLLPEGWSPTDPNIDRIAPVGVDTDADYTSGGDTTPFVLDVGNAQGPFQVEAKLYYQTLSHRFAEELWLAQTPETEGLRALLDEADQRPDLVATSVISVP